MENNRPAPIFALLLISVGCVLLLNNFGIIDWNIWSNLWRFWPLLLILGGLQRLGTHSRLAGFLTFLVSILVIIGIILLALPNSTYGIH